MHLFFNKQPLVREFHSSQIFAKTLNFLVSRRCHHHDIRLGASFLVVVLGRHCHRYWRQNGRRCHSWWRQIVAGVINWGGRLLSEQQLASFNCLHLYHNFDKAILFCDGCLLAEFPNHITRAEKMAIKQPRIPDNVPTHLKHRDGIFKLLRSPGSNRFRQPL